jgi:bifunctional N-acetylglucosamine-1-phosphate-uridyltransferase/glucosamine-1-phosphate-acetyltransferase GlmU-like protein
MAGWTGVVLALREAQAEPLGSRLSTYLHPLAGRPLAWHAVHALATLSPAPARVLVAGGHDLVPELFADVPGEVRLVDSLDEALEPAQGRVLALDGAAPLAGPALALLLSSEGDALLEGSDGEVVAGWLGGEAQGRLATSGDLRVLRQALPGAPVMRDADGFAVRTREGLARASSVIRDRIVRRLMEGGVTFLLPEAVLVDVDVQIGRDTIVYPWCVLEGKTTIGEETVIGPCCRIDSTRVGSGVELKGFNYLSHTSIRNRAILEPYVRRGFDE